MSVILCIVLYSKMSVSRCFAVLCEQNFVQSAVKKCSNTVVLQGFFTSECVNFATQNLILPNLPCPYAKGVVCKSILFTFTLFPRMVNLVIIFHNKVGYENKFVSALF